MRIARNEARQYLQDPKSLRFLSDEAAEKTPVPRMGFAQTTDQLLRELRKTISRLRGFGTLVVGRNVFPDADHGPSDFDVRHSVTLAASYNFPELYNDPVGRVVLRNWSFDGILRASTATPVNIVVRSEVIGDSIVELQRPDLIPGVPLYLDDPTVAGGRRINRAAFSEPLGLRQGTLGYNALRGFGVWQFDLAVRRQFGLGERLKLQLKVELLNLFDHPNFENLTAS